MAIIKLTTDDVRGNALRYAVKFRNSHNQFLIANGSIGTKYSYNRYCFLCKSKKFTTSVGTLAFCSLTSQKVMTTDISRAAKFSLATFCCLVSSARRNAIYTNFCGMRSFMLAGARWFWRPWKCLRPEGSPGECINVLCTMKINEHVVGRQTVELLTVCSLPLRQQQQYDIWSALC